MSTCRGGLRTRCLRPRRSAVGGGGQGAWGGRAEADSAVALRRDGPFGSGYPLHELAQLEPLDRHSCGVPKLDGADGIYPRAVWTLAGPDAVGVTTFVLQLAASINRAGGCVLVVNGHMATHHLYRRMMEAREAAGVDGLFRGGVELASWMALPSWRVEPQVYPMPRGEHDVVILDTFDEMTRPARWPHGGGKRLSEMRWLREYVRAHNTALVLTARVPTLRFGGPEPFMERWGQHWVSPVFADIADIADVRMEMWQELDGDVVVHAYRRGQGWVVVTGRRDPFTGWLRFEGTQPSGAACRRCRRRRCWARRESACRLGKHHVWTRWPHHGGVAAGHVSRGDT